MPNIVVRRWLFLLSVMGLVLLVHQSRAEDSPPPIRPYEQSAVLLASDGYVMSQFGHDIVAEGTLAVVSAPWQYYRNDPNVGAVYLFERRENGWEEVGRLPTPPDVQTDGFGSGLALDGDMIAVRAKIKTVVTGPGTGPREDAAVLLYQRADDEWELLTGSILTDKGIPGGFGIVLALDGDTLAVSGNPNANLVDHAVYIFNRIGETWVQQAQINVPPNSSQAFPSSLSLHGDILLVGDPGTDGGGIVHIYRRSGNEWLPNGTLEPATTDSRGFGSALAFDGQTAVVASCSRSPHDTDNYVNLYTVDEGTWNLSTTLPLTAITNQFECSTIALDGERFVVAAKETNPLLDPYFSGGAFLFSQVNGQWTLAQFLDPGDIQTDDWYGSAAALAGNDVLVAASYQNHLNAARRGAVHVFTLRTADSGTVLLPMVARGELTQTENLIAFVLNSNTYHTLGMFISTADGRGRTQLTQVPINSAWPDWSPDGRSLVFVRYDEQGSVKVATLDIASGQLTTIAEMTDIVNSPRWSPDGQRIAFTTPDMDPEQLYFDIFVVDRDGQNLTNLTQTPELSEFYPAWSPDGLQIVYEADNGLEIMDADGQNSHRLPGTPAYATAPDWSPDGQAILYTDWNNTLYTIPPTGGVSKLIMHDVFNARWSPDGTSILFTGTGGGIFRVDPITGQLTVINPDKHATHPDEQP
ncbi:MAG: hypothetical protein R3C44_21365 [Chloroflexota bacterium]